MAQIYSNNAASTLALSISAGDTALAILPGDADEFPVADGTDYFKVTLEDEDGNIEIVKVTERIPGSSSFSVIVRGQEGTTPRAYAAGSVVECRLTAEDINYAIAHPSSNPSHDADTIAIDPITGLLATNAQEALEEISENVDEAITLAATTYVRRAGDTMTGPLILSGDPSNTKGAATKQYVDNSITTAIAAIPSGGGGGGGTTTINVKEIDWANKVVDNQSLSSYALTSTNGAGLYKVRAAGNHNGAFEIYFFVTTMNESVTDNFKCNLALFSTFASGLNPVSNATAIYKNVSGMNTWFVKTKGVGDTISATATIAYESGGGGDATYDLALTIKDVWKIW